MLCLLHLARAKLKEAPLRRGPRSNKVRDIPVRRGEGAISKGRPFSCLCGSFFANQERSPCHKCLKKSVNSPKRWPPR